MIVRFFLIALYIIFKISFKTLSESAVFSVNRLFIICFIWFVIIFSSIFKNKLQTLYLWCFEDLFLLMKRILLQECWLLQCNHFETFYLLINKIKKLTKSLMCLLLFFLLYFESFHKFLLCNTFSIFIIF